VATRPSHGRRARISLRAIIRGWPWYYETAKVVRNEVLLRTVPNGIFYYTKTMGNWAINPSAFEPAKDDVDGISLFREDFVTPKDLASVNPHPNGVRVARVFARQFGSLNLSVKPSPDASGPPGHAIVPELHFVRKTPQTKDLKRKMLDLAQKLAQFASKNKIYTPQGMSDPIVKKK